MRSIFRYPGGKSRRSIRDWILSHRPAGVVEYREPFVGGGGVFFAADSFARRWANDLSPGLIAVYQALRDRPAEFIAKVRAVNPDLLAEEYARVAADDAADLAHSYFVLNRTSYAGMVNPALPCRTRFHDADGWAGAVGRLEEAARRLAGVRVTCGGYEQLLFEPGEGVWVYCDPPYVTKRNGPAAQVYQHSFAEADHRRFAEAVKASPHRIAVSYGDDDGGLVRSLFPAADGFTIVEAAWHYGHNRDLTKRPGRELLILNYPPPAGALTLAAVDRPAVARPARPADDGKRRAVLAVLNDPATAGGSVAWTARTADVSQAFAVKVMNQLGIVRQTVRGANGRTYRARIGRAA